MATAKLELTEEELFQLFDLALAHGAEQEMCEKLAETCRKCMRRRTEREAAFGGLQRVESVLG